MSATAPTALRLKTETRQRLEALGKARNRSPHQLMNMAIEHFLDTEEAVEAERKIMKERWERYSITGEAIDHSDVKSWAARLSESSS